MLCINDNTVLYIRHQPIKHGGLIYNLYKSGLKQAYVTFHAKSRKLKPECVIISIAHLI